jgi:hypothetical protein
VTPCEGSAVRQPRSRRLTILLTIITIALGLASRRLPDLPRVVSAYAGDVLWATMVFWIAAFVRPAAPTARLAAAALAIAAAVEVSQLYHAPWLDAVRATRPGALALGQGFLWSDLACYAAGVGAAALIDLSMRRAT